MQRGGWLDALRFVAAALMVVHHYHRSAPVSLETLHPVFERGYLLTDFFLIDSGYVLARIYGARAAEGMSALAFLKKRVVRLVPMHLLMMAALIGLVLVGALVGIGPRHAEWFDWKELPAQLFLVQAYGVPGGRGWNAPTWSISALLGCYLLFPSLMRLFVRSAPLKALAAAVLALLVGNLLALQLLHDPIYQLPLKYGFIRALPLFVLGVALARVSEAVYIPASRAAALGRWSLGALVLFQVFGAYSLVSLGLISLIILAAAAIPVRRPSKLVERAALASFAMFITNEVVRIGYFGVANELIARLHLPVPLQWGLWAGGIATALLFAFLVYALVDAPSQRWIAKRLDWSWSGLGRLRSRLAVILPQPKPESELSAYQRPTVCFEVPLAKGRVGEG